MHQMQWMDGFLPRQPRRRLMAQWLALAVFSLVLSGVLSFIVSGARLPWFAPLVKNTSFPKRLLIVHVDLGVLIWFGAMAAFLFHFLISSQSSRRPSFWARVSPWVAWVGTAGVSCGLFLSASENLLVNYIPLIRHEIFIAGVFLFLASVGLSFLDAAAFEFFSRKRGKSDWAPFRWPLVLGVFYYLWSGVLLGVGWMRLSPAQEPQVYYENLMWGAGHTLQLAHICFLWIAWAVLLAASHGKKVLSAKNIEIVSLIFALSVPFALRLVGMDPASAEYRVASTQLMQWGIFPAVLVFLALNRSVFLNERTPAWWIFFLSAALLVMSFIYGAGIRGSDLRIPGHYHAAIGAVTLALMGVVLVVLEKKPKTDRVLKWMGMSYALGQGLFSSGLFVAGFFGMARKTYGVDQKISHPGQMIGFAMMGVGGIFALLGGGIFGVAAIRRSVLTWVRKYRILS